MSNIEADEQGLLVACAACGQRNRMRYDRLGGKARCGKCRADLTAPSEPIDIRSDLSLYRVWRDGVLVDEVQDIGALWRDDLVSFVIGCSFSFEQALMEAGIALRHVDQGRNVAMYRSKTRVL